MSEPSTPVRLAERMSQLPDYLFGQINALRQKKRRGGMDLIDMSMGNPIDPTPQPIVDKLVEVVQDRRNHRYSVSEGIFNLRNELAKYYLARFDVVLNPDEEIIFTIGSKEGFSHLCLALIGPGDTAIVPAPAYPIHSYSVILAGGNIVRLRIEDDEAFCRDVARVCSTHTPAPKVVFLNYPHNPTGKCVELEFFREMVRLAKRYDFIIVHDFAYSRITYDGYQAPSFLEVEGAKEVGCEFGTMSKAFNMAGWRIGYAMGNRHIIQALGRIKGYYDYGIFQAIQIASIIARLSFIDNVVGEGKEPRGLDITLSAGDLPLVLGMKSAADIPPPYPLPVEPDRGERMAARLKGLGPPPYVGVTWRAGTTNRRGNLFKEAPLADLGRTLRPLSATVLVLQRNPEAGEIDELSRVIGREAHDLTALNDDLEDMLAALSLLDEYVAVSNTNVQLRAGAGRTSRVLIPNPPEWRWMVMGGESPWFPGCPVYRQKLGGDWGEAFATLTGDLLRSSGP